MIRNYVSGIFYDSTAVNRFHYYPMVGAPPSYATPVLWIDGVDHRADASPDIQRMWAEYSGMISDRRLLLSPLEMDFQVEFGAKGDS